VEKRKQSQGRSSYKPTGLGGERAIEGKNSFESGDFRHGGGTIRTRAVSKTFGRQRLKGGADYG